MELKTIISGQESLSGAEWSDLRSVARMCPYIIGDAVYRAQALLISIGEDVREDDSACNVATLRKRTEKVNVSLYPNPTTGMIAVNGLTSEYYYKVNISDVSGKLVHQSIIRGSGLIDISLLKGGVYFVNITDDFGFVYSDKIIRID